MCGGSGAAPLGTTVETGSEPAGSPSLPRAATPQASSLPLDTLGSLYWEQRCPTRRLRAPSGPTSSGEMPSVLSSSAHPPHQGHQQCPPQAEQNFICL